VHFSAGPSIPFPISGECSLHPVKSWGILVKGVDQNFPPIFLGNLHLTNPPFLPGDLHTEEKE